MCSNILQPPIFVTELNNRTRTKPKSNLNPIQPPDRVTPDVWPLFIKSNGGADHSIVQSQSTWRTRTTKTDLLGWKTARRYEIPFYNACWSTRTNENFFVARIRRWHNGSTVRTVRSGALWSKSYQRSSVAGIFEVLVHLVPITEQIAPMNNFLPIFFFFFFFCTEQKGEKFLKIFKAIILIVG